MDISQPEHTYVTSIQIRKQGLLSPRSPPQTPTPVATLSNGCPIWTARIVNEFAYFYILYKWNLTYVLFSVWLPILDKSVRFHVMGGSHSLHYIPFIYPKDSDWGDHADHSVNILAEAFGMCRFTLLGVEFSGGSEGAGLRNSQPVFQSGSTMNYGLNCVPPKRNSCVQALTPNTSECDLVWKWGSLQK